MFQFQIAYWKGGAEMNFGLFGLGTDQIGQTDKLCDKLTVKCRKWPVHCLTPSLSFLPGALALRAEAVSQAWNGSIPGDGQGFCGQARRLSSSSLSTKVECHIHANASSVAALRAARLDKEL